MDEELDILRAFLAERLAVEPARVTAVARLEDLGVDSLLLLEAFFQFEERLGIRLDKDVPTPKTVGDLIATVRRLRGTAVGR